MTGEESSVYICTFLKAHNVKVRHRVLNSLIHVQWNILQIKLANIFCNDNKHFKQKHIQVPTFPLIFVLKLRNSNYLGGVLLDNAIFNADLRNKFYF